MSMTGLAVGPNTFSFLSSAVRFTVATPDDGTRTESKPLKYQNCELRGSQFSKFSFLKISNLWL